MKLSLSVRIAEAACKTRLNIPFPQVAEIAAAAGYSALCMRASVAGVQSSQAELEEIRGIVDQAGLVVSMVTADLNIPQNNDQAPQALRHIEPSLHVAEVLGSQLVRVCLKTMDDIPYAQQACDLAAERGIQLVHQFHPACLFEELDKSIAVLKQIDRPNFGLIYEPASLLMCGQDYGKNAIREILPWLRNAYVQNLVVTDEGPDHLETWCLGDRPFRLLPYWDESGQGIDFTEVFSGLKAVDYQGFMTVHQAEGIVTADDAYAYVTRCRNWIDSFSS
ncbi:sugar phosphate isomerase/epimerase family protein [Gimesia algae]|uniref:Xylose isomerase-like TIM barrel n=1 Tax=Gimesia algae TaxID=2527971 RepID=A0A517VCM4_9PLAN|nr:sugar phosphate isomerase/epimerase [Gimesia algae]QDT90743.1 Xylose isomerase-like TIM barrel [Gimesia algae]